MRRSFQRVPLSIAPEGILIFPLELFLLSFIFHMFVKRRMLICFVWAMVFYFPMTVSAAGPLPLVKILATGGTIAAKYDPVRGGFVAGTLTGEELTEAVPEIKEIARIELEQICNTGSPNMDPAIWIQLSKRANALLANQEVTGVVVTHGTDTLEETAYFLDLTVTSQKPVILVGAQRAATMKDSDGPRNLLNAIRVAISPEALGKGAMIVMNGQINAAREVTKTNTIEAETFRTLEFGQLGIADLKKVKFYRAPLRRQTVPLGPVPKLGRVEIVSHYGGNDGWILRALLKQGHLDGLVIAGTGLGHVGRLMFAAVKEARDREIPVVVSTRVYTGRVIPLYAGDGGGLSLQKIGCVFADNLSPQKARILLMLALTKTKETEELQKYFDH